MRSLQPNLQVGPAFLLLGHFMIRRHNYRRCNFGHHFVISSSGLRLLGIDPFPPDKSPAATVRSDVQDASRRSHLGGTRDFDWGFSFSYIFISWTRVVNWGVVVAIPTSLVSTATGLKRAAERRREVLYTLDLNEVETTLSWNISLSVQNTVRNNGVAGFFHKSSKHQTEACNLNIVRNEKHGFVATAAKIFFH